MGNFIDNPYQKQCKSAKLTYPNKLENGASLHQLNWQIQCPPLYLITLEKANYFVESSQNSYKTEVSAYADIIVNKEGS